MEIQNSHSPNQWKYFFLVKLFSVQNFDLNSILHRITKNIISPRAKLEWRIGRSMLQFTNWLTCIFFCFYFRLSKIYSKLNTLIWSLENDILFSFVIFVDLLYYKTVYTKSKHRVPAVFFQFVLKFDE